MNLSSHLVERVTRLGPPRTRGLAVQRGLPNATTWRVADQEVHHDPGHASAVLLPVG